MNSITGIRVQTIEASGLRWRLLIERSHGAYQGLGGERYCGDGVEALTAPHAAAAFLLESFSHEREIPPIQIFASKCFGS
jgi:hypothetical protein